MHIVLYCCLNTYVIIWLNPASTLQWLSARLYYFGTTFYVKVINCPLYCISWCSNYTIKIRHILSGFFILNNLLMILAWVLYGMIKYPWKEMFWKTWYLLSWTINLYKNGFRRWTIPPGVYFIQNIKGDLV